MKFINEIKQIFNSLVALMSSGILVFKEMFTIRHVFFLRYDFNEKTKISVKQRKKLIRSP